MAKRRIYSSRSSGGSAPKTKPRQLYTKSRRGDLADSAEYIGASVAAGLGGVGEGITDLAAAGSALMGGHKERAKSYFLDNKVADWREDVRERTNPGALAGFLGDVGQGIGQSSVFLLDAVAPGLGTTLFFTGIGSQGVSGAAAKTGDVGARELIYGTASGAVEGLAEKFVGAGGKAARSLTRSAVKTGASKAAARGLSKTVLLDMAKSGAGEAAEEAISELTDVGLQKLTGVDKNASTSVRDLLYSSAVGLVSGGLMTAPISVATYKGNQRRGEAIAKGGEVERIINLARATRDTANAAASRAERSLAEEKAERAEARAAERAEGKESTRTLGERLTLSGNRRGLRKEGKRAAEFSEALDKNLAVWEGMDDARRDSAVGYALLGEMQGNLTLHSVNAMIDEEADELLSLTDEELEVLAGRAVEAVRKARKGTEAETSGETAGRSAGRVAGRSAGFADAYTAAEVRADKDAILSQMAALRVIEELTGEEATEAEARTESDRKDTPPSGSQAATEPRREEGAPMADGAAREAEAATVEVTERQERPVVDFRVMSDEALDAAYGARDRRYGGRMPMRDQEAFFAKLTTDYNLKPYVLQCLREDYAQYAPGEDLRKFSLGYMSAFMEGKYGLHESQVATFPIPKAAKENARLIGQAYRREEDAAKRRKRTTEGEEAARPQSAVRESVRPAFISEVEQWARDGMKAATTFVLGETGSVLQGLGATENDILLRGDKIKDILGKHSEMTIEEIKRIPQILDDPILILKSQNVRRGDRENTRMVIFGAVKTASGQPVMAVLDLRPVEDGFVINGMQKVSSAYAKTQEPVAFVRESEVMYADKKRSRSLLRTIGFQMPMELSDSGFIGSISYEGQNVKLFGEKFTEIFREVPRGRQSERTPKTGDREKTDYVIQTPKRRRAPLPGAVHLQDGIRKTALYGRKLATVRAAEVLASAMGNEIYLYDSHAYQNQGKLPNGWIDRRGDLHIDINAGMDGQGLGLFALAHESVHFMRDYAPEEFRELGDRIIALCEGEGVDVGDRIFAKMDEMQARGRLEGMNTAERYDLAYEELIADSLEGILKDGKAVDELVKLRPTLFERIVEKLREIIDIIQRAYARVKPESEAGRMLADMAGAMDEVREMYVVALATAGERRRAEGADSQTRGDVRYAERISFHEETNEGESKAIIRIIHENTEAISDQAKFDVAYSGEADGYTKKTEYIKQVFEEQDNMALNPTIGHVELRNAGAKSTIAHGYGQVKLAAVRAIKSVIEEGQIVSFVQNYKNTGVDRYVIAAKGMINREAAYIGVVVKSYPKNTSKNKFYLHEAEIIKADPPIMTAPQLSVDTVSESAFDNSIPQSEMFVNTEDENNSGVRYSERMDMASVERDGERRATRTLEALIGNKSFNTKDRAWLDDYGEQLHKTRYTRTLVWELERSVQEYRGEIAAIRADIQRLTQSRENEPLRAELIQARKDDSRGLDAAKAELKTARERLKAEEATLREMEISDMGEKLMRVKRVVETATNQTEAAKRELASVKGELREERRERITAEGRLLREREKHKKYKAKRDADAEKANEKWSVFHERKMEQNKKSYDAMMKYHLERHEKTIAKGKERVENVREENRERIRRERERKQKTEALNKRRIIVDIADRWLTLLEKPTKTRNIPKEMETLALDVLSCIHFDPEDADVLIQEMEGKIAEELKSETPDIDRIGKWEKAIERVKEIKGHNADFSLRVAKLYSRIKAHKDANVRLSYDPEVEAKIDEATAMIGDKTLDELSLEELQQVRETIAMVVHAITENKKLFSSKQKETVADAAAHIEEELGRVTDKRRGRRSLPGTDGRVPKAVTFWKGAYLNELKPIYFFDEIESPTLRRLFHDLYVSGERAFARDLLEIRAFREGIDREFKTKTWDRESRKTFKVMTKDMKETTVKLNLGQIMAIYADSKREQAVGHLLTGGFCLDPREEESIKIQGRIKTPVKTTIDDAVTYRVTEEQMWGIVAALSDEQRRYVDKMVDFLSSDMARKGNEVSMKLYGVELFNEEFYFPIQTKAAYRAAASTQQKGEPMLKNLGMTKPTVPNAQNPLVLSDFDRVWAGHCTDMTSYHALVLPIEDLRRVFEYGTTDEAVGASSTKAAIINAYGEAAERYISTLLTDLNGGLRQDPTASFTGKMISLMKKSRVMASLSVVVQQPMAAVRAMALVDPKYFPSDASLKAGKSFTEQWERIKRYSDTAVVKDIGGHDVGMSSRTADFINAPEYEGLAERGKAFLTDAGYRDEVLGWAPATADRWAWMVIWGAVENEVADKQRELTRGSEEFYRAVGARFDEVVRRTQVYDSVMARSAFMRSKNAILQMATAFMAEPTTTVNMMIGAIRQFAKGDKKAGAQAMAAVYASMLLTALASALVYAARDDDEDETYSEKYVESLSSQLRPAQLHLNLLPFVRDAVSLFEGYDIQRTDMTVVGDVVDAIKTLQSDRKSGSQKLEAVAGSVGTLFGLPARNVLRDLRAVGNLLRNEAAGESSDLRYAFQKGFFGKASSDGQRLYDTAMAGDTVQYARIVRRYETEAKAKVALRRAIRDNDPRIAEAADARLAGDLQRAISIRREIVAEGHFSDEDVLAAVNAEVDSIKKQETKEGTT